MNEALLNTTSILPQELQLVSKDEAGKLLYNTNSLEELPSIKDTLLGDPTAKKAVLLIHGFTGTNLELLYLGNALAQNNMRVLIPLLPGHGTHTEDLKNSTPNDWMQKVTNAYNFLKEEKPDRDVVIIGHSLGGALAINLSATLTQISALILLATPIRYPFYLRWFVSIMSLFNTSLKYDEFKFRDKSLYDHPIVKYLAKHYKRVSFKSINDIFNVLDDAYNNLPEIDVPVKLIYSSSDYRVPKNHVTIIEKRLGTENVSISWMDNSDHVLVVDNDKDNIIDAVNKFLDKIC